MLPTDVDGLHGAFLTVDENGERLFALTTDKNTLTLSAPAPTAGAHQLVLANPDGESVWPDAAFIAQ